MLIDVWPDILLVAPNACKCSPLFRPLLDPPPELLKLPSAIEGMRCCLLVFEPCVSPSSRPQQNQTPETLQHLESNETPHPWRITLANQAARAMLDSGRGLIRQSKSPKLGELNSALGKGEYSATVNGTGVEVVGTGTGSEVVGLPVSEVFAASEDLTQALQAR